MSPNPIFLNNPNDTVVLFGKEYTAAELNEAVQISNLCYNKLSKIMKGDD